ncbi:MAG TPA: ABC transporter permease [bacterium]|nr:ABC transporter permease [bacterium]HQO34155.1 ABC transporter permease [bacterium]HQQ00141.1 ABC transporter permease [bacterium]
MPWREVWRILRKDRLAMISLTVITICAVLAALVHFGILAEDVSETHRLRRIEIGEPSAFLLRMQREELVRPFALDSWIWLLSNGLALESAEMHGMIRLRRGRDWSYHPPTVLIQLQEHGIVGLLRREAWAYPLGTNLDGQNVLSILLHGLRWAFIIGVVTSLIAIPIAVVIGSLGGYFGGIVDDIVVWIYSTFASVPQLLLLIALLTFMDKSMMNVLIVIGVTTWVDLCRLVRAEFFKHKEREYVLAARSLGQTHTRIIFRHILPNVSHIVIITFTIRFVQAVSLEVFLSYVGIGVDPSLATWGQVISAAKDELARQPSVWWPLTGATVFLFILSLAFSIVGDSLRDALDPKLRT